MRKNREFLFPIFIMDNESIWFGYNQLLYFGSDV